MKKMEPITIRTAERLFEDMKKRRMRKQELLSNCDYISWLEKFTLIYESFTNNSWLYEPKEISEEDITKVRELELFFDALYDYCDKYLINMASEKMYEDSCINIKHNGVGYQLGFCRGQGAYVYVERKTPADNAIDFSQIVSDTAPEDFETKRALLMQFEQIVSEMKEKNIPTSIMLKIINE